MLLEIAARPCTISLLVLCLGICNNFLFLNSLVKWFALNGAADVVICELESFSSLSKLRITNLLGIDMLIIYM